MDSRRPGGETWPAAVKSFTLKLGMAIGIGIAPFQETFHLLNRLFMGDTIPVRLLHLKKDMEWKSPQIV